MAEDSAGTTSDSADEDLELLGFDSPEVPVEPIKAQIPPSPEIPEVETKRPPSTKPPEAFGRVLQAEATRAGLTNEDLAKIPEAVVVDTIQEAMPVEKVPVAKQRREIIPSRRRNNPPAPGKTPKPIRRIGQLPETRTVQDDIPVPAPNQPTDIEPEKFHSMNEHKEGNFRVPPLVRDPKLVRTAPSNTETSKFLDGELPRHIERGVTYPHPVLLVFTSFVLVMTKMLLYVCAIAIPLVTFLNPDNLASYWWLPALLLSFGAVFLISANKTRCKVCTCHLFFKRNCHTHNKAHRVPLLGQPTSAALHLLLFKWLRCMYCGTAIRIRKPTADEKEAMVEVEHQPQVDPKAAAKTASQGEY